MKQTMHWVTERTCESTLAQYSLDEAAKTKRGVIGRKHINVSKMEKKTSENKYRTNWKTPLRTAPKKKLLLAEQTKHGREINEVNRRPMLEHVWSTLPNHLGHVFSSFPRFALVVGFFTKIMKCMTMSMFFVCSTSNL